MHNGCQCHPRYEPTSIFEITACRWAPWLPIGRNGDFGTSPFFGQLFGTKSVPCLTVPKWACRRQRTIGATRFCAMSSCGPTRAIVTELTGGNTRAIDNFFSYPLTVHVWFIYIACSRQAPLRRLNQSAPEIVIISSGALYRRCSSSEDARPPSLVLSFACRKESFIRNFKGVSRAKRPKDDHECASPQTGSAICSALEAVDTKRYPARAELSKCAKNLRAVSGARPR